MEIIDGIAFLKTQCEKIKEAINLCYPDNLLDVDKCHGQLLAIEAYVESMDNFLDKVNGSE